MTHPDIILSNVILWTEYTFLVLFLIMSIIKRNKPGWDMLYWATLMVYAITILFIDGYSWLRMLLFCWGVMAFLIAIVRALEKEAPGDSWNRLEESENEGWF